MARSRLNPVVERDVSMQHSGPVVHLSAADLSDNIRSRPAEQWQRDNWRYYDVHGEVHYPFTIGGNLAGRVDLDVQERVDGNWAMATDKNARASHDAVVGGGLDDFWRSVWINYGVSGEGVLLVNTVAGTVDLEVCSNMEVYQGADLKWMRTDDLGHTQELDLTNLRAVRFWRNHPRIRNMADSGLRSVQNECKELHLLKLALLAKITSRLASVGILFLPNSISVPAKDASDGTLSGDPLIAMLTEMFMAPIANPDAPAAAMPVLMRGPDDAGAKIRHIVLDTALDAVEETHRAQLVHSIALGIELPLELQEGIAKTNHWNAWHVDEAAFTDHVLPVCRAGALLLTTRVLWPWLRINGMEETRVRAHRFWPDGSKAALGLNRADLARQLYDRLQLSGTALRAAHGYDDTAAPMPDEMIRLLGVKLNNPLMAAWNLDVVVPEEVLNGPVAAPAPPGPGGFDAQTPLIDSGTIPGSPGRGLDHS